MENFVRALVTARNICSSHRSGGKKPLLIKIAPDLTEEELNEVLEACERGGADGLVVGNTTLSRPLTNPDTPEAKKFASEAGGMSGHQTFSLMANMVYEIRKKSKIPIVATGGLDSTERGRILREHGADLVQVHTPLYFRGPKVIPLLKMAA